MVSGDKNDMSLRRVTYHIVKEALILAVGWCLIVWVTTKKQVPLQKLLMFLAIYIPGMIALNYTHRDLTGQLFTACAAVMGAKLFEVVKV